MKKMIFVGDSRYDGHSVISHPEKGQILDCYDFGVHGGIKSCRVKGYDFTSRGGSVYTRLSALREITNASNAFSKKLAEGLKNDPEQDKIKERTFTTTADF